MPSAADPPQAPDATTAPKAWLRAALGLYLVVLTFVLLAPDPLAWLRTRAPGPAVPLPFYLAWLKHDKVQHFVAYALLAALLLGTTRWTRLTVLLVAAVHGGAIEILQLWSPPRSTDLFDWFADLAGAGAVLLAAYRFFPRR